MQDELDNLESSLKEISPAAPPPKLMDRLRAATSNLTPACRPTIRQAFRWPNISPLWRYFAPAASVAALVLLVAIALRPAPRQDFAQIRGSSEKNINDVQVNQSLLASFDTVAQLPGGEPVRFRCREWQDDVVIHDDVHGVVISQSTPRVEVIPVRFETY